MGKNFKIRYKNSTKLNETPKYFKTKNHFNLCVKLIFFIIRIIFLLAYNSQILCVVCFFYYNICVVLGGHLQNFLVKKSEKCERDQNNLIFKL